MPIEGVQESARRAERVQSEERAAKARAAEQRSRVDENRQTHRATEAGRGENMDVTA